MPLYRLLYRSDCALSGSSESIERQVADIVAAAATANEATGLTGSLSLGSSVFVQILEGSLPQLEDTFERICGDVRHRHVRLLDFAAIEERMFDAWSMVRARPAADICQLVRGLQSTATAAPRLDAATAVAAVSLMRTALVTEVQDDVAKTLVSATIHRPF